MKKVQIVSAVCIGAILLVTVCYLIYGRSTSQSKSGTEGTRQDTQTKDGIAKNGIYEMPYSESEKEPITCPPCPDKPAATNIQNPVVKGKSSLVETNARYPRVHDIAVPSQPDTPLNKETDEIISATTMKAFAGEITRKFPKDNLKFHSFSSTRSRPATTSKPHCEQWAVMTTIFDVSEAVRRQVKLRNWCLVVIADKKSFETYNTEWTPGEGNDAVVYLRPDDQTNMEHIKPFVDALPWNHFGRKNIGYLYAIMHGAKVIYDFDDDNLLKFWIPGAAPPGAPSLDAAIPDNEEQSIDVSEPKDHNWPTYNPYPILGAPTLPSWPRGLPLDDIKVPNCSNTSLHTRTLKAKSIGVLQSLAEYQPDVDAIFRLTMPIPFFFNKPEDNKHLMIPKGTLTPYNAQATLHFYAGFFGLFLPIAVTGRVTDIWRSFFAQRLFWDVGVQIGFIARPLVVQDRNIHSNIGDLTSEWDIYTKSKPLMTFLESWRGKGRTIVERTEELWVALYEREYIEYEDVMMIQLWLQALLDVGYRFPDIVDQQFTSGLYPERVKVTKKQVEKCTTTTRYKFWTSDRHDGCRIDMPSVLSSMGHNVTIAGTKGNKTNYPFVFKRPGIKVYDHLSSVIRKNNKPPTLTENMIMDNFKFYKNDQEIASTDVFLCSYPSSQCEMWMPFNKTIAVLPAHRYNLGRCGTAEWNRWTRHLQMLSAMDNPKHIIAASSVYDQEYLRYYTGLDPLPLYSLTTMYMSEYEYNPSRKEILCVSRMEESFTKKELALVTKFKIVDVYQLYPHYELSDLVSHRAMVYFPYSSMSYKLSEIYGLGIPLFMPSPKYLRISKSVNERTMISRCTNNRTALLAMKPDPRSTHPYNPNVEGGEDENYWLQFSDFYQWPHITYFDDMLDLEQKLNSADFARINKLMVEEVRRKKEALFETWCKALKGVDTGRKVPSDYHVALHKLYGVSRLQVD